MKAARLQDIAMGAGEHVVQFYEQDRELERPVGRYLAGVVAGGGVAIVIATEPHRAGIAAEMALAGLDPAACAADGSFVMLDAGETLSAFCTDGAVDRERFAAVVGSVVRQAVATGRAVCAFGEMVALLWERGDVIAAIELEAAWNDLAHEFPFMLICAYRSEAAGGDEHAGALERVCCVHSRVVGAPGAIGPADPAELSAEFSAEADAPRRARHFVAEALSRWGHDQTMLDDARLVVTELATNAVMHARSSFSLRVRRERGGVRLAVSDYSQALPRVGDPGPDAIRGRGMPVVAATAADWGVVTDAGGKTIWAELGA